MKSFRIAREALIAVFVCSILMDTMNKSINKVLATQNVIQSLEQQQFDYLFKCAGVKLISCWGLRCLLSRENLNATFSASYI